ncbi:MAG: sigma-54-dependent transcriptional regulator [Chthoniobacterales bacterium]
MRVLVVDDEQNIRRALTIALESMEHEATSAPSGCLALKQLKASRFDVVLLDLKLSQEDGLGVLDEALRISPTLAVVMMTAFGSIETAVEAMRRGAFDYLPKPCTPEQLRQVLARIGKTKKLEGRVAELESRLNAESPQVDLGTHSPVMQKVLDVAFKAAGSDATVLLLGETGTGKSVLARAIHQRSARNGNAFVTVSCPSLTRELLASELFGHVKGAFTGALNETWGKVTAAEAGTLFLDEIGDLPVEIQAKLLRLIQEREYERVGETTLRRADVRVIAATNHDLTKAVAAGNVRQDLFYRLNVIAITLPPLRERLNDIEKLAMEHLQFIASHSGKPVSGIAPDALEAMKRYQWPGNIRELRNVIERAVILSIGPQIQTHDLMETLNGDSRDMSIGGKMTLAELEAAHIQKVVANAATLEEAAATLGIDPATLYRKRKKLS